jgi:excisionase family DNA binding protein
MVLARPRCVTSSNQSADGTGAAARDPSSGGVPVFFTAQQVADMLQVDERTVLRWAQHDASMPAIRLGRVVRFEREPLLKWLARKQPRAARGLAQASLSRPTGAA